MIFGDTPLRPQELVEVLELEVAEVAKTIGARLLSRDKDSNTVWTLALKTVLMSLAERHSCLCFCSSREHHKSEFMLDFVWWEHTPDFDRAVLGRESEWGNPRFTERRHEEVAADFEKLLSFKAPMKLLVFEAKSETMRENIHAEIRKYGTRFAQHVKGESYIFVEFSGGTCKSHSYEVKADGRFPDFNPFGAKSSANQLATSHPLWEPRTAS